MHEWYQIQEECMLEMKGRINFRDNRFSTLSTRISIAGESEWRKDWKSGEKENHHRFAEEQIFPNT